MFFNLFATCTVLATAHAQKCAGKTTAMDVIKGHDLSGRVIAITGGDSGIGYQTALALASANASVVLMPHNKVKGAAAAENITRITSNSKVTLVPIDTSSLANVHAAATALLAHVDRLDVLLCDAGLATQIASLPPTTADGYDRVFEVNILGHVLLVEKLRPLLRHTRGRVIHVSSAASFMACKWADRSADCTELANLHAGATSSPMGNSTIGVPASNYGLTKYLQVWHGAELAMREPNVTAFSLHPGVVATPMLDSLPAATLKEWCAHTTPCPLTPAEGAATPTYLAAASQEELPQSADGKFFETCQPAASVIAERVLTKGRAATLQYQSDVFDLLVEWANAPSMHAPTAVEA